jgi:hypothetical protein
VLPGQVDELLRLWSRDVLPYPVIADSGTQHATGARGQFLQIFGAQSRKRLPRLLQQPVPIACSDRLTHTIRHRLLRVPLYCSKALNTFAATSGAGTL